MYESHSMFLKNVTFENWTIYVLILGARGGVVVKALRYKPVGRRFDHK